MDTGLYVLPRPGKRAQPEQVSAPTLFQEDWWLEAASGGRVERVEVRWDAVRVASLSFVSSARFGAARSIDMPHYTRTLGPVVTLPASKPTQHALNLQRVVRELRAKLPPHDRFHQILDPEDETPFAFALAGFSVAQAFTFRAYPHQAPEAMMANLDPATRRLVKAGGKALTRVEHADPARFLRLAARDRSPDQDTHEVAVLERLFAACFERRQGTFLTLVDDTGRDLASVFLVWDHRVAYYLVPVRDREASNGGTNAFLVWSAMNHALDRGLVFDFDSFASVGTGRFLSSFGFKPLARSVLSFRSPRRRLFELAKGLARRSPAEGLQPDMHCMVSLDNARPSHRERVARCSGAEPG